VIYRVFLFFIALAFLSESFAINDPFLQFETQKSSHVFIPVQYADASILSQSLNNTQLGLLSPKGKAFADERSNQIYIKDDAAHLQKIREYIRNIDRPLPQILIRAKIIAVDHHFTKDLGILFKSEIKNPKGALQAQESLDNFIKIPIVSFSDSNLLSLQIHALEEEGHAFLLSTPEIITLNRQSATIESGEEIPYQESSSSGATSVTFKKAVLKLTVKPFILPGKTLLLNIQINQDKVSTLMVNGVPAIKTRQLSTSAMMKSGQTLVLGGIFETANGQSTKSVPGLNKVPILGRLMSEKQRYSQRHELLIFITPQILFH
jgi:type IV pilus assembly protein PilQ